MTVDPGEYHLVARQGVTAELAVLRRIIAGGTPDPATLAQVRGPLLTEVARLNKLTGFLAPHRALLGEVFPEAVRSLDQRRLIGIAMNRHCVALGREIEDVLAAEGIRHLHLKGVLQQAALYDDPYRKPTNDVDLLIDRRDFRRAERLLTRVGLVCDAGLLAPWWRIFLGEQHYHRGARPMPGHIVDLHYKLQQPGSPAVRHTAAFIDRAVPQTFEGRVYPVPSPVDRCLIAAISLVKAAYGREAAGGYVADLAAALSRLTTAETAELPVRSDAHGLRETLDFATCCVDALLVSYGAPVRATGPNPMPRIGADRLCRLVMEPWAADLEWPRRREVLRALCGPSTLRYGVEVSRGAMSEGLVRVLLALPSRPAVAKDPAR